MLNKFNLLSHDVLIGGLTSRGSGFVIRQLEKNFTKFIDTSGLHLTGASIVIRKTFRKNILFQPSIAGHSILRDLMLLVILLLCTKNVSILLLCDPKYSKLPFVSVLFWKLIKIFKLTVFSPANTKIGCEVAPIHHLVNEIHHRFSKVGEPELVYFNFLNADKGLNSFHFRYQGKKIYGTPTQSVSNLPAIACLLNTKHDVSDQIKYLSQSRAVVFYCSQFDLAPILLQKFIMNEILIAVEPNSVAEKVISNQWYNLKILALENNENVNITSAQYDHIVRENKLEFVRYKKEVMYAEPKNCILLYND